MILKKRTGINLNEQRTENVLYETEIQTNEKFETSNLESELKKLKVWIVAWIYLFGEGFQTDLVIVTSREGIDFYSHSLSSSDWFMSLSKILN